MAFENRIASMLVPFVAQLETAQMVVTSGMANLCINFGVRPIQVLSVWSWQRHITSESQFPQLAKCRWMMVLTFIRFLEGLNETQYAKYLLESSLSLNDSSFWKQECGASVHKFYFQLE